MNFIWNMWRDSMVVSVLAVKWSSGIQNRHRVLICRLVEDAYYWHV